MSAACAVSWSCNSFDAQENALRRRSRSTLLVTGALAVFLWTGSALADKGDDNNGGGDNGGAVRLLTTIPVPGTALRAFDISWVDASTQRYYLADRSNQAVDVIDAKKGTFLKQISRGFAGAQVQRERRSEQRYIRPQWRRHVRALAVRHGWRQPRGID